jgi:hypothetical protein
MTSAVNRRTTRWIAVAAAATVALGTTLTGPPPADAHPESGPQVQLEDLDRGLVAAATAEGVFLSWRLLGEEVTGRSPTGLRGPAFRVYRDRKLIATVANSTNYLDRAGRSRPGPRTTSTFRCRSRPTESLRRASATATRPTT